MFAIKQDIQIRYREPKERVRPIEWMKVLDTRSKLIRQDQVAREALIERVRLPMHIVEKRETDTSARQHAGKQHGPVL